MHIEKARHNRFRKLVTQQSRIPAHPNPSSFSEININKQKLSNKSYQTLSKQMSQDRLKQFIRQKKMRTISSIQDHKPQTQSSEPHLFEDHKMLQYKQMVGRVKRQKEKTNQIKQLISEFKTKTDQIFQMELEKIEESSSLIDIQQELEKEQQFYQILTLKTKISATSLINIYLTRWTRRIQSFCLDKIAENVRKQEDDYLTSTIPIGPPSGFPKNRPNQRNLMNVHKFLNSQ